MDLLCQTVNPFGELFGIRYQIPRFVSASRPTIVHNHVFEAEILEPQINELFGSLVDYRAVEGTAK